MDKAERVFKKLADKKEDSSSSGMAGLAGLIAPFWGPLLHGAVSAPYGEAGNRAFVEGMGSVAGGATLGLPGLALAFKNPQAGRELMKRTIPIGSGIGAFLAHKKYKEKYLDK